MRVRYVPLLPVQRQLQALPRDRVRFQTYLTTVMNPEGTGPELTPLLMANPMAKEHVTALLDALQELGADEIARDAAGAAARAAAATGEFDAALVVVDDLMGGWTNRFAAEFTVRFESGPPPADPPAWFTRSWLYGALWSSEQASARVVREAMAAAVHRMDYVSRNGLAPTLRDRLAQEGWVMAAADCSGPTLDADDLEYTREVIAPFLDAEDMRTTIECLFGDAAGATLGFTARGLSPWAGLALARHDARVAGAAT